MEGSGVEKSVLGLDLSLTSAGVIVLGVESGKVLYSGTVGYELKKAKIKDAQKRLFDISESIVGIMKEWLPVHTVIEDYAFNTMKRGATQITKQAELMGVVLYRLYRMGVEPIIMPASQARSLALGDGWALTNMEKKRGIKVKEKLAVVVEQRHSLKFSTDDEMDAFIIAGAVRRIMVDKSLTPEMIESARKTASRRKGKK